MASNHASKFSERVRDSLEQAQARLANLEEEAQRMVSASRKEVANLLDNEVVKDLSERARHVSEDVSHRVDELRDRVIAYMGVASREQVQELARDLEKLSRKLDRALAPRKPAAPKPERKAPVAE